jgi:hypothetical protein
MAQSNFQKLLQQGRNQLYDNQKKAFNWYKDKSDKINSSESLLKQNREYTFSTIQGGQGHMFLFNYVPKLKDKLPMYDLFPLCIPFRYVKDGFYGVNLHYLDYKSRAVFFDQLTTILNNDKWDETTKFQISYSWIQKASKLPGVSNSVKHYLSSHVRSRFMYVPPLEWSTAIFLPLSQFVYK